MAWAAALAVCVPALAHAKPVGTFEFLVADEGDQTRPSIDGQFVVYSGPGPTAGEIDVLAVVTDEHVALPDGVRRFGLREIERLTDFVETLIAGPNGDCASEAAVLR